MKQVVGINPPRGPRLFESDRDPSNELQQLLTVRI